MDLKEEQFVKDCVASHWYYRAKSEALIRFLRPLIFESVLDVGAGSAYFVRELIKCTSIQQAVCVDTGYLADRVEEWQGKTIKFCRDIDQVDVDLALFMDVLEHVDDDVGMLHSYAEKIIGDAHFLITVPAFSFLWSAHDIFLGHKRRYHRSQLETVVRRAGLEVLKCGYMYASILPAVIAYRIGSRALKRRPTKPTSDLSDHCKLINLLLSSLCRLELKTVFPNRLAGLTVFCLARKSEAA